MQARVIYEQDTKINQNDDIKNKYNVSEICDVIAIGLSIVSLIISLFVAVPVFNDISSYPRNKDFIKFVDNYGKAYTKAANDFLEGKSDEVVLSNLDEYIYDNKEGENFKNDILSSFKELDKEYEYKYEFSFDSYSSYSENKEANIIIISDVNITKINKKNNKEYESKSDGEIRNYKIGLDKNKKSIKIRGKISQI